ncbi:hypothetical protein D7S89_16275 [Trinickia fusca]|uniref:Uncharacterized protein n=1 Tax=Trinickia fusca TaxID=2419777 RepID=A0A494X864_9BURK|nr:hypothetical protein D7S89_16275 [Trinickia fusca]
MLKARVFGGGMERPPSQADFELCALNGGLRSAQGDLIRCFAGPINCSTTNHICERLGYRFRQMLAKPTSNQIRQTIHCFADDKLIDGIRGSSNQGCFHGAVACAGGIVSQVKLVLKGVAQWRIDEIGCRQRRSRGSEPAECDQGSAGAT